MTLTLVKSYSAGFQIQISVKIPVVDENHQAGEYDLTLLNL